MSAWGEFVRVPRPPDWTPEREATVVALLDQLGAALKEENHAVGMRLAEQLATTEPEVAHALYHHLVARQIEREVALLTGVEVQVVEVVDLRDLGEPDR